MLFTVAMFGLPILAAALARTHKPSGVAAA
jgi:hypothetical protein